MDEKKRIYLFDTTLRDGQQCPGAGMSFEKNIQYAQLAADVGVDVLEAGFPSASKVDFQIVQAICKELSPREDGPIIAGLCQLREQQVDATIASLESAVPYHKARVHIYLPVDPELMQVSLGDAANDKSALVEELAQSVQRAVSAGMEVEFSPEGYSRVRGNFDFCTDLIRAAVQNGARVINCPDTIGGACKLQGKEYFVENIKRHAEIIAREFPKSEVIWSAHCHNDFGLALENSLNAVFFGPCRQVEGCFGGIGERAGNVALEQVIMTIREFAPCVDAKDPFVTRAKTEHVQKICSFVAKYMLPCQPHWPITGSNASKHSSGGHTNAILKNPLAYQPFDPKDVGKEVSFVFGPLSGGNHAKAIIEDAGYVCSDEEKSTIAQYIKDMFSDRRKGVTDEEVLRAYRAYRAPIALCEIDYGKSANRASVRIRGKFFEHDGEIEESHDGRDSALAALKKLTDQYFEPTDIQSHKSESDTEGINANSVSTIVIKDRRGELYKGVGSDQDIEISAMRALIDAINNAYIERQYYRPGVKKHGA